MRKSTRNLLYIVLLLISVIGISWRINHYVKHELVRTREETVEFQTAKTSALPSTPGVRYLLIVKDTGKDKDFSDVLPNLQTIFLYAKLPLDVITWEEWNRVPRNLDAYVQGAVILLAEDQADLNWAEQLKAFVVEKGGLLVNAWRSPNSPLNEFCGIKGSPQFVSGNLSGLHWTAKLYPGMSDLDVLNNRVVTSSLDVVLDPSMKVMAESSSPKQVPYFWFGERGKGRVEAWNITTLGEKSFRGIFLQGVLKAQPLGVKAAVGAQVWYIDDFPAPVGYDQVSRNNQTGMTDYQFRLEQWNPDMQRIANKHGIRYSSGVIFTYSDNVTPPFGIPKYEKLFDLEQALIQTGGELGLHGYNHLPYMLHYTEEQEQDLHYSPWLSTADMKQSLQVVKDGWKQLFKSPLPTFYIPPSNVLSTEGKKAVVGMLPQLKTISSIYISSEVRGGFEQEFLPDPDFPQIMGTPRVSYGYDITNGQKLDLYSAVANVGIVSHFNHPDDVFDPDRNRGKSWKQLQESFDQLVGKIQGSFGWMRPLTATQLADALRVYQEAQLHINRSEPGVVKVTATPLKGPLFLEVRIPDGTGWTVKKGGTIVQGNSEYGLLWISMDEPDLVLEAVR